MAATHGQSPSDLKSRLVSEGHRFSFFQALRLLNRVASKPVRIRPELSLAFPATDVVRIEERADENDFLLTASFLGLYGVSSTLPTFYTEDLFHDDSAASRDFLDIIHQRLYALLFQSWKKYRLFIQIAEDREQAPLDMLYAICGLKSYELVRYAGMLGGHPRSAMGLSTILTDFLKGAQVEVISFVSRAVKIPEDQRWFLGSGQNRLGQDTFLGEAFEDRQGKFRVRIGPLERGRFRALLQGGQEHRQVVNVITQYLTDPLDYDFELILQDAERHSVSLGKPEWSRLGLDTTIFSGEFHEDLRVVFPPETWHTEEAA